MAAQTESEPPKNKRAYLVGLRRDGETEEFAAGLLEELGELAQNIGFDIAGSVCVNLREPNPRYLVGAGKFSEIRREAKKLKADCIIFDDSITPAQQRNWERESRKCVIDRQEVILEIFARRALTKEARLQVELARLVYSLPRLKRAWTHLSRQRGGVNLRGAGESQLETDRRRVVERISRLKKEIEDVKKVRATQRKRRERNDIPVVAIVGYTNAGKSSLMNCLSGAGVLAQDKLFATLDPTTRELKLPGGATVLLTDTVGFVRRLPH
ncbi:MAG: GTPase HflX, partial [Opitutales bacterium]|nr:GTPase HflX [Opitutales bacterium]